MPYLYIRRRICSFTNSLSLIFELTYFFSYSYIVSPCNVLSLMHLFLRTLYNCFLHLPLSLSPFPTCFVLGLLKLSLFHSHSLFSSIMHSNAKKGNSTINDVFTHSLSLNLCQIFLTHFLSYFIVQWIGY